MKNYQKLFPLILIILMVFSTYKLVSDKVSKQRTYNGYIKQAEDYYKQGIIVDAVEQLELANSMKPDIDILLKEGKYYLSGGYNGDAASVAENILTSYPKDAKGYDFALTCYLDDNDYDDCYDLLDEAEKRGVTSKSIKKVTSELEYRTFIGYTSYDEIGGLNSGYYFVKSEENWGYCNKKGSLVIGNSYSNAGPFMNDVAPVTDLEGNTLYIDKNGYKKINIPKKLKCKKAGAYMQEGIALLCNGKYGYYDKNFEFMFGSYDYASAMYNSVAAVKNGESWYLVNEKGKEINKSPYTDVKSTGIEIINIIDCIFVQSNGKYIIVNSKGHQIGSGKYDDAVCFNLDKIAAVKIGNSWGFVDDNGKTVIEPQYENARSFSSGLAAVKQNGKWGYINSENKNVIKCTFDDCLDFNNEGYAFVKNEGEDKYVVLGLYSKNH